MATTHLSLVIVTRHAGPDSAVAFSLAVIWLVFAVFGLLRLSDDGLAIGRWLLLHLNAAGVAWWNTICPTRRRARTGVCHRGQGATLAVSPLWRGLVVIPDTSHVHVAHV